MEVTMTTKVVMVLLTLSLSSLSLLFQDVLGQTQAGQQVGNQPPVADASPDQRVNEGDLVSLNGSSSFDPDGEIVSYAWGIEDSDDEAPPISLTGQNTSIATFTAPMIVGSVSANSYLFELTVTDNDGLKDTATSKIVVEKSPV
jgi:large repetitive protein